MESTNDINERLLALGEDMAADVAAMQSGEEEAVSQDSPDDARKILRWLKNLGSADTALEAWLDGADNTESLKKLVRIFRNRLAVARKKREAIAREHAVEDALNAAATLTLAVLEYTQRLLPLKHSKHDRLDTLIVNLPSEAELRMTQPARRVIETLELGMDRVSGKSVQALPVHEQLAQASQRVTATTRQLSSVDTLPEPAREESIELAREILRRLRNMHFSDMTMQEIVDTGRPEEKVVLVNKLEEMLDIFKNLLLEAAAIYPGIMQRQEIKDATDTAGAFDHAIKLMASREMPDSMAATQQIGAEATHEPKGWKHAAGRTLDRLLKSLQVGVEMAADIIEQEQQRQQQRAEEQAQENKDLAVQQSSGQQHGRKRRRRRRSSGGGMMKASARRNAGDLNGDGIADNLQGLDIRGDKRIMIQAAADTVSESSDKPTKSSRSSKNKPPSSMPGLKADALEAVQKLGNDLRNIGKQAQNIPPVTVTNETKIVPDDKGFATRNKEDAERDKNKPGHNRPGV